ncbi:MAG: hypothetical protein JWO76_159 [Nocardioides sp.]|nr:hypothetical protein [Nocardioides sp.]
MRYLILSILIGFSWGCSSADSRDGTGAGTAPAPACVEALTVRGESWTAWPLSRKLTRDLVGSPVLGSQVACEDVSPPSAESPSVSEVTLRRIRAVPARSALFREDAGYEDVIYVPGTAETTFENLPPKVRRLIKHG